MANEDVKVQLGLDIDLQTGRVNLNERLLQQAIGSLLKGIGLPAQSVEQAILVEPKLNRGQVRTAVKSQLKELDQILSADDAGTRKLQERIASNMGLDLGKATTAQTQNINKRVAEVRKGAAEAQRELKNIFGALAVQDPIDKQLRDKSTRGLLERVSAENFDLQKLEKLTDRQRNLVSNAIARQRQVERQMRQLVQASSRLGRLGFDGTDTALLDPRFLTNVEAQADALGRSSKTLSQAIDPDRQKSRQERKMRQDAKEEAAAMAEAERLREQGFSRVERSQRDRLKRQQQFDALEREAAAKKARDLEAGFKAIDKQRANREKAAREDRAAARQAISEREKDLRENLRVQQENLKKVQSALSKYQRLQSEQRRAQRGQDRLETGRALVTEGRPTAFSNIRSVDEGKLAQEALQQRQRRLQDLLTRATATQTDPARIDRLKSAMADTDRVMNTLSGRLRQLRKNYDNATEAVSRLTAAQRRQAAGRSVLAEMRRGADPSGFSETQLRQAKDLARSRQARLEDREAKAALSGASPQRMELLGTATQRYRTILSGVNNQLQQYSSATKRAAADTGKFDREMAKLQARLKAGQKLVAQGRDIGFTNIRSGAEAELARDAIQNRQNRLQGALAQGLAQGTDPRRVKNLTQAMAENDKVLQSLNKRLNQYTTAQFQAGALLRQFFRYALGYGALYQVLAAVTALTRGLVDLNAELTSIRAISGASAGEMLEVESAIKRVALTTKFTTTEIAQAGRVLAQSGVPVDKIRESLAATANFAAATNSSIETASDLMSTLRNVFTELDSVTVSDRLTKAVNISKLTADDLKSILSISAQIAQSFNLSSEQYLAAVTTLRNAGLKATTVATGLRQGLIELFNPDSKTLKALEQRYQQLNEDVSQDEIRTRFIAFRSAENPLLEILREIQRIDFLDSRQGQRAFDVRAENAIRALTNRLDDLAGDEAQLSVGGSALLGSEIQLTSLKESLRNLGAAITVFADSAVGDAIPKLRELTLSMSQFIGRLTEFNEQLKARTGAGIGTGLAAGLVVGGQVALRSQGTLGQKLVRGTAAGAATAGVTTGILDKGGSFDTSAIVNTVLNTAVISSIAAAVINAGRGRILASRAGATAAPTTGLRGAGPSARAAATTRTSAVGKAADATLLAGALGSLFSLAGTVWNKIKAIPGIGAIAKGGAFLATKANVVGWVVTGLVGLFTAFDQFSRRDQKRVAMLQRRLSNIGRETADVAEIDREAEDFRFSSAGVPSREGSMASAVEDMRDKLSHLDAQAASFLGKNTAELADLLQDLSDRGSVAASPARRELLRKLASRLDESNAQAVMAIAEGQKGMADEQAQLDRIISGIASGTSDAASAMEGLRKQIYQQFQQIESLGEEASEGQKAFASAVRQQFASGNFSALAGDLATTPTEMLRIVEEIMQQTSDQLEGQLELLREEHLEGLTDTAELLVKTAKSGRLTANQMRDKIVSLATAYTNLGLTYTEALERVITEIEKASGVALSIAPEPVTPLEGNEAERATHGAPPTRPPDSLERVLPSAQDRQPGALERFLEDAQPIQVEDSSATRRGSAPSTSQGTAPRDPDVPQIVDIGRQALESNAKAEEEKQRKAREDEQDLFDDFLNDLDTTELGRAQLERANDTQLELIGLLRKLQELGLEVHVLTPELLEELRSGSFKKLMDTVTAEAEQERAKETAIFIQRQLADEDIARTAPKARAERDLARVDQELSFVGDRDLERQSELFFERQAIQRRLIDIEKQQLSERITQLLRETETNKIKGQLRELYNQQEALERKDLEQRQAQDSESRVFRQQQAITRVEREIALSQAKLESMPTGPGASFEDPVDRQLLLADGSPVEDGSRMEDARARGRYLQSGSPFSRETAQKDAALEIERKQTEIRNLRRQEEVLDTQMAGSSDSEREAARIQLLDDMQRANEELGALQRTAEQLGMTPMEQFREGFFGFEEMANSIERANGGLESFGRNIQGEIVSGISGLGSALTDAARDGEHLGDTLRRVFSDIAHNISRMAADLLAQQAFSSLFRMFSGSFIPGASVTSTLAGNATATGTSDIARIGQDMFGRGFKDGGIIKGAKGVDKVPGMILDGNGKPSEPIRVSDGEAILNVKATKALGEDFINDLNSGKVAKFATGGMISSSNSTVKSSQTVGKVLTKQQQQQPARPERSSDPMNLTILNLTDRREMEDYLNSRAGDQVLINRIRKNAPAINQSLGRS